MDKKVLKAEKRKVLGRKVKVLRGEGVLPANVYGKKVKSQSVQVSLSDFEKVYKEVGETGLVELVVLKEKRPVLIHNVQKDPVTDSVIHADFLQVDLKQKVTAEVPVEVKGEAPAEKTGLGTMVQQMDEIKVEALPQDLPEKFEVDVTSLIEVDQAIFVKDIKIGDRVEVQEDKEQIVVKIEPLRKEEEEAPTTEAVEEEVTEEGQEGEEKDKEKEDPINEPKEKR